MANRTTEARLLEALERGPATLQQLTSTRSEYSSMQRAAKRLAESGRVRLLGQDDRGRNVYQDAKPWRDGRSASDWRQGGDWAQMIGSFSAYGDAMAEHLTGSSRAEFAAYVHGLADRMRQDVGDRGRSTGSHPGASKRDQVLDELSPVALIPQDQPDTFHCDGNDGFTEGLSDLRSDINVKIAKGLRPTQATALAALLDGALKRLEAVGVDAGSPLGSAENVESAKRLHADGMSVAGVASRFGVSRATASRWIKR